MTPRHPFFAFAALVALGIAIRAESSAAEDRSAPELLPDSTILYGQIAEPKTLLDLVFDHPLKQEIEARPEVHQALASRKFQEFRAVVTLIEGQIDMKWREAISQVTGGGRTRNAP